VSESVSRDELKKLPYLRHLPADGRIVSLQSFYDQRDSDWHLWLPVRKGELGRIAGGEVVTGSYYSAGPVEPQRDFEFPLGTLLTMQLSFPRVVPEFAKLENDVHRLAAVLQKYHLISSTRGSDDHSAHLLVLSELEYLLMLLRSLCDVLQHVVRAVASLLIHLDGSRRRVTKNLPTSFADVVTTAGEFRSEEEIQTRWDIPAALANWYVHEAPFFRELRGLRDGIAHHGRTLPSVYSVDWGFAIDPKDDPWNQFGEWPPDRLWEGRLGSLRSVFAGFTIHALQACTRFASTLPSFVQLPTSLNDELRFYVRSPCGAHLVQLELMRAQPWEGLDTTAGRVAG
jgi:hypothetical protein